MSDQQEDQKKIQEFDRLIDKSDLQGHISLGVATASFGTWFLSLPLGMVVSIWPWALAYAFFQAKLAKDVEQKKEEILEAKITQLLKSSFDDPATLIYSRLDGNQILVNNRKYLNIALVLASKKVFFISIRSITNVKSNHIKIFFDTKTKTLRYRKGRSGKKDFFVDPIVYLKEQARWILNNCKGLFQSIPYQIVVFDEPSTVYNHEASPTNTVRRNKYMKVEGVYVVTLKDLVGLIQDLNQPKKKRYADAKKEKVSTGGGKPVVVKKIVQGPRKPLS